MHEHATLIDSLDPKVIAAHLFDWPKDKDDRSIEAVYKWKRNGIAWRWRQEIASLARRKRIALPSDFLSATTHLAAAKSNPRRTTRR